MKKSAWTKEEDVVLREQVQLHGARNWESISAALPGRNSQSCRLRWCQHLAPEVDAARSFTPQEDATVIRLQKLHPNKWATIAGYLPGRTDNAIKNRWNSVLRKQQQKPNRTTLTLFRLVPGDIRTIIASPVIDHTPDTEATLFRLVPGDIRTIVASPVIDHTPDAEGDGAGGDQGSSCLDLFPLAPGDIVRSNASGAAPMDVDFGADDPLTELRLSLFP